MVIKAEIIDLPYSGQYKERIYDIVSPWNSQSWTWVKFIDEDYYEWCGEFRGAPKHVAISKKYNTILVLTTDYLFQVDCANGELIDYESQTQYHNLTVSPAGDFLVADYYGIDLIGSTLKDKKRVQSPVQMDMIRFVGWSNDKLIITCDEFLNWDNHLELELDAITQEITVAKSIKKIK